MYKLDEQGENVLKVYNNVKHCSLDMTPTEVKWEIKKSWLREVQFKDTLKYNTKREKTRVIIKYKKENNVLIKNEIHKYKGQYKFDRLGIIEEELENDTYKIKLNNGKVIKRHGD